MGKSNRVCMACQKKYSYCPDCSRADALKPAWTSEFCSESCKDLWLTLTRYNMGMHSKPEAQAIISALDLKPTDTYVACVQRDYNKVMAPDPKPKRGKRAELKIFDEAIIEQVATEPESHEVVIEKEN